MERGERTFGLRHHPSESLYKLIRSANVVCATVPLSAAAFGRIFIRSADPPRQWAVPALGSPPIALVLGRRQRLGILGMGARTVVEPYWNPAIGLHGANNSTKPGAILIVVIHEALLQTSPRCEQQADIAHVRRRRFSLCWCVGCMDAHAPILRLI